MDNTRSSASRADASSRWMRPLIFTQIAVQVGMALTPFWALSVEAAIRPGEETSLSSAAQQASGLAEAHQSGNLSGYLSQQVTGAAVGQAQEWLKQWGTARVELGTDEHFKPQTGSFDLLLPLNQTPDRLLFAQQGLRNKDGQFTGNFGLGQRHFTSRWMFGYNAFYDQNISRSHKRMGIGAEAWRDYLKLSGNGYYRLSSWRNSVDVEDYDARPANGFDLRAEAWLPVYPAIGGRFMYEKYYGEEVALFSKERRQSNPAAFTAGLSYTPVPLVSFTLDHKASGHQRESQLGLQFNYQLGQTLSSQLDPSAVNLNRTLAANRMALVERNNNIVLEYRKQELIQLGLPTEINGRSGKTVALNYKIISKYGLASIIWNDAEIVAAGGHIQDLGNNQYQIVLPRFIAGGHNRYTLSGVAIDTRNNRSKVSSTVVNVSSPAINASTSTLSASPTTLLADGKATSQISILLRDENEQPVTDVAASIALSATELSNAPEKAGVGARPSTHAASAAAKTPVLSAVTEKGNGEYLATLTAGTRAADVKLSATIDTLQLSPLTIKQISDTGSATVADGDLRLTRDNVVANGSAIARAEARVTDAMGNPVAGVTVTFALSGSAQVAAGSSLTAISDDNGLVVIAFTDTAAETITVTASTANGSANALANFIADASTAALDRSNLTVDRTTAIANGSDSVTFSALIKDANGNPVPGVKLNWHSNGGALSAAVSQSGKNGIAIVTLKDTAAHDVQVQAQLGTQAAVDAPVISFTADAASATIDARDFIVDKTSAVADGSDLVTYTITVKDKNGNPLPAQVVNWQTSLGTLSQTTSVTGPDGKTQVTLTSTQMGQAGVSAALVGKPALSAVLVTFAADASSARIGSGDLTVDKTTIVSSGTDAARFTAVVKDANGNPVAHQQVNWTSNLGKLSDATSVTNVNGEATVTFTGTTVGSAQIIAAVNGNPANAPRVNIVADAASARLDCGDLTANKTSALANGSDSVSYTARVIDAAGNLVSGVTVGWSSDRGTLSSAASVTGPDGKATITLTSTAAGNAQVKAVVNSRAAVNAPVVDFKADAASASISDGDLTVNKTSITAGTLDMAIFRAVVKDAHGNPVANLPVSWATSGGTLSGTTSTTNTAGEATISLTATLAGTVQVNARVNSSAAVNAPPVTVTADTASAQISNGGVTADKVSAIANSGEKITYSATIKDAYGNPLSNLSVSWSTDRGNLAQNSSKTNVSGVATVTLSSTVLGAAIVTAQPGSGTAVAATAVEFTAETSSASLNAGDLIVDARQIPADNTSKATYTALVKDRYGNPVKGLLINWTTNFGQLNGQTQRTDDEGKSHNTLQSGAPGKGIVSVSVGANAPVTSPEVEFVVDSSTATITSMQTSKNAVYGFGGDNPVISVVVKNAQNQAVPNYKVNWSTDIGSIDSESFTDATGTATATLDSLHVNSNKRQGTVQALLANTSQKTISQTITPVYRAGNHQYLALAYDSTGVTPPVQEVRDFCNNMGAHLAGSAELAVFAQEGGDFVEARTLLTQSGFISTWYALSDSWKGLKGNFDSTLGTVGDIASKSTAPTVYIVCTR